MKILPNSLDNSVENVAVIMSTYNGERYIREQIESILNQKKVSVLLFIRDDGSKDNTRKIIKEYCTNYRNVIWIDELKKENLGVRDSFLRSLTFVYGFDSTVIFSLVICLATSLPFSYVTVATTE